MLQHIWQSKNENNAHFVEAKRQVCKFSERMRQKILARFLFKVGLLQNEKTVKLFCQALISVDVINFGKNTRHAIIRIILFFQ